jgi:hypothetical protein
MKFIFEEIASMDTAVIVAILSLMAIVLNTVRDKANARNEKELADAKAKNDIDLADDKVKNDKELADQLFRQKVTEQLILSSLTPDELNERINALHLLVTKGFLSEEQLNKEIKTIANGNLKNYPQFTQDTKGGIGVVSSMKEQIIAKNPALKDRTLALVALKVSAGEVIDSIIPIFNEITPDLKVKDEPIEGEKVGGNGSGAILLEQKGYIITGIDVYRGYYFGRDEVYQIQVIWHKLSTQGGIDPNTRIVSDKLGTGANVIDKSQPPKQFRTTSGNYFSDFRDISFSYHDTGESFLHDFEMGQDKLPIVN